jgi:hypothetical protein
MEIFAIVLPGNGSGQRDIMEKLEVNIHRTTKDFANSFNNSRNIPKIQ